MAHSKLQFLLYCPHSHLGLAISDFPFLTKGLRVLHFWPAVGSLSSLCHCGFFTGFDNVSVRMNFCVWRRQEALWPYSFGPSRWWSPRRYLGLRFCPVVLWIKLVIPVRVIVILFNWYVPVSMSRNCWLFISLTIPKVFLITPIWWYWMFAIFYIRWTVHLCPNYIILIIIPVRFWSTYTSGPFCHTVFTIAAHITTYLGSFCYTLHVTVRYVCYMFRVCEYQRWVIKAFSCWYVCPWVSRFYRVTFSVIIIWVLCTSGHSLPLRIYFDSLICSIPWVELLCPAVLVFN